MAEQPKQDLNKPKIVDVSANKRDKNELPPNHHAFFFQGKDPDSGEPLVGDFVCKRITVGGARQMSLIKAELNGGNRDDQLDPAAAYLNTMQAQLRVSLTKAPDWWRPDEFYSADIITYVFEEVMAFEARFRDTAARKRPADPAPDSPQPASGA